MSPIAWVLISVTWLVTNLLTWNLTPALGPFRMYVAGSLPFIVIAFLTWAARRIGFKEVCFSALPLLLVLVAIEGGLRVYFHHFASRDQKALLATPWTRGTGDGHLYVPHHYSIYELNSEVSSEEGLHHNSLGFRDHREFVPDGDAIRIVFVGGSTTYTHNLRDNDKIFSAGLERKFNEHFRRELGGRRIEVINAGLGGATSAENLIRLMFFVSEVSPDLVVIQHGINDVHPRAAGTIETDYANYRKRWEAPSIFDSGRSIAYSLVVRASKFTMLGNYLLIRARLARPAHLSLFVTKSDRVEPSADDIRRNDTRYFERNTRYMIALARTMGAEVMLATVAYTDRSDWPEATGEHNALIEAIAADERTLFYDFANEMIRDDEHLPDGVHVSQRGSDLKRDLYFRHLLRDGIIERLLEGANK